MVDRMETLSVTLHELIDELMRQVQALPMAKDQQIYNISIRQDASVAISLETMTLYVDLFKVRTEVD